MNSADGMDDIVKEFIVESTENLDQLDRDLISLEKNPTSKELLGSIFRAVHTVKGTSWISGVLPVWNRWPMPVKTCSAGSAKACCCCLRRLPAACWPWWMQCGPCLTSIEKTGSDGDTDYAPLIEILTQLQAQGPKRKSQHDRVAPASSLAGRDRAGQASRSTIVPDIAEEDLDEPLAAGSNSCGGRPGEGRTIGYGPEPAARGRSATARRDSCGARRSASRGSAGSIAGPDGRGYLESFQQ